MSRDTGILEIVEARNTEVIKKMKEKEDAIPDIPQDCEAAPMHRAYAGVFEAQREGTTQTIRNQETMLKEMLATNDEGTMSGKLFGVTFRKAKTTDVIKILLALIVILLLLHGLGWTPDLPWANKDTASVRESREHPSTRFVTRR